MWRLHLVADQVDLERIERQLPASAPNSLRVERTEDKCFLTGGDIDGAFDAAEARAVGNAALERLNLGAWLKDVGHRHVPPATVVMDGQGRKHAFVSGQVATVLTIAGTGNVVTSSTGRPPPRRRSSGELVLDLAPMEPAVERVAALTAKGRTPSDLYKVFEVVREQATAQVVEKLVPRSELSRFTHSVNHPGALGDDARHAVTNSQPPSHPMLPNEMAGFIAGLVARWLEWLAAERGVPVIDPT